MGFNKIQALSLTDLFVREIEKMILSGELEVGEQLPPARDLAIKMGVSRPVISAGLIELEQLGFVEIKPRQGVYVCDYRRKGTIETLVAIMQYNGGALRAQEVKSLLEVRDACECLMMKLVTSKCSREEIETLRPILDDIKNAKDSESAAECVFHFYHELAIISGNEFLPLLYYSFREQSVYLWNLYCKKSGILSLYEIKLDLYQCLISGDTEGALSHTHDVLENAQKNLSFYCR